MPVIDLSFRVQGTEIPADHSYLLYKAITNIIPKIHPPNHHVSEAESDSARTTDTDHAETKPFWKSVFIHPINGQLSGDRMLRLTQRSRLTLRLGSDFISAILPIAGKTLRLGEKTILIGIPTIYTLKPSPRLYSRLVVIRGFTEPGDFLDAANRQLSKLGIKGKPSLLLRKGKASFEGKTVRGDEIPGVIRRTIRIKDKDVVGFALEVSELCAEESLLLQEEGLGGRQHFGCGVFIPSTRSIR